MRRLFLLLVLALAPSFASAQSRIASDFEIAQMQRQLATSPGFTAQVAARLNLGDARRVRNESELARAEYARAFELAGKERAESRRDGALTRYATATSYAALAAAKLGHEAQAFELAAEAMRYEAGSAKSWNLDASVMSLLGYPVKAIASASNAVTIAENDLKHSVTVDNQLDLAVYQYALAGALAESHRNDEAMKLLRSISSALERDSFATIRRSAAESESFEVQSSARGDVAAYLSLVNRVHLRLGALQENAGDAAAARESYARVLRWRTDDATALAAMARLSGSTAQREQRFAEAFDANPFSKTLVDEYRRYLASGAKPDIDGTTVGVRMRAALARLAAGDRSRAAKILEPLRAAYPDNDTVASLLNEANAVEAIPSFLVREETIAEASAADLAMALALLASGRLTAVQRGTLDRIQLRSEVTFDEVDSSDAESTAFLTGLAGSVKIRFAQPVRFRGAFASGTPLHLTYRILGLTQAGGSDALLVEAVQLEKR
jgi:hypothetical protein